MGALLDLIKTHYEGVKSGDLDRAAANFADDVVTEMPFGVMHGIEAFRQLGAAFQAAAPDMDFAIRNAWEIGDTVIVEGSYTGTQTGPLASPDGTVVPPTGRAFSFPYVDIAKVRDGKVVEHRTYWDNVTFFTQLGLMPEPEAAPA